jgi:hypothetical protein
MKDDRWPFPLPEPGWHKGQRSRWDLLETVGWKFKEAEIPGMVGLAMSRDGIEVKVAVAKSVELELMHTMLLEACEGVERACQIWS